MEDIVRVCKIDLYAGVVKVGGICMRSTVGFSIGSPIAAGASALFASVVEELFLELLTERTRAILKASALLMRWMDDVCHVWKKEKVAGEALKALRVMQSKEFYRGLELLKEKQAQDAFGFRFTAKEGVLGVQSEQRYLQGSAQTGFAQRPKILPGSQYTPCYVLRGTVTGRIIRLLVATNKTEEEAEGMVCRLLGELRRSGYERRVLRSSIERVKMNAWGGLRCAASFLKCSVYECETWRVKYDALLAGCEIVNKLPVRCKER